MLSYFMIISYKTINYNSRNGIYYTPDRKFIAVVCTVEYKRFARFFVFRVLNCSSRFGGTVVSLKYARNPAGTLGTRKRKRA